MVNIKTAIITGLAAFYLGLTSSPALADAPAYSKTTLADKATCSSSSSVELMEKDLTCFTELAKTIQRYDGWQSPCSSEKADPKDGRLGSLEYAKSLIMEYILWNSDCDKVRKGDRKSTRLNSSHMSISYAVFCLKKKNKSQSKALGNRLHTRPPPVPGIPRLP